MALPWTKCLSTCGAKDLVRLVFNLIHCIEAATIAKNHNL